MVAVGLFEAVDRADVRMAEGGEDFGFALETRDAISVLRKVRGHRLDGDLAVQAGVSCQEHFTHAAPAEFAFDLVGADGGWVHEGRLYGVCVCGPMRGR